MSWNYRVVKHTNAPHPLAGIGVIKKEEKQTYFTVHEVFYDKEGRVNGHDDGCEYVCSESVDDLREHLLMMLAALEKPVLETGDGETLKEATDGGSGTVAQPD